METPSISIVIPTKNPDVSRLIKAINSCRSSKLKIEVILVSCEEDGFDDSKISSSFDFVRIHRETVGVSRARNIGLNLAKNDYVVFLDCDDELSIESLENLPFIDIEEPDAFLFSLRIRSSTRDTVHLIPFLGFVRPSDIVLSRLFRDRMPMINAKSCYKVSFLKSKTIYFDEEKDRSEDSMFNGMVLALCSRLFCSDSYLQVYKNDVIGSLSNSISRKRRISSLNTFAELRCLFLGINMKRVSKIYGNLLLEEMKTSIISEENFVNGDLPSIYKRNARAVSAKSFFECLVLRLFGYSLFSRLGLVRKKRHDWNGA